MLKGKFHWVKVGCSDSSIAAPPLTPNPTEIQNCSSPSSAARSKIKHQLAFFASSCERLPQQTGMTDIFDPLLSLEEE